MRSVLFFIESLDGGGAEGALENIITYLDKTKFDLHVISETDGESRTERIRANSSSYRCFAHKNTSGSKMRELFNRLIFKFSSSAPPAWVHRVLIRGNYDIEVAGCEGYATRLIGNSENPHSKKIAWIHTDFLHNPWSESVYPGGAREEKECYGHFDAIVCVSETIRDAFIQKYGYAEKIHLIHNIVDDQGIREKGAQPGVLVPCHPHFVLAGSFLPVKGYDRAVRVFARLRDLGYTFSVRIMGIGYEREPIEKIIQETKMSSYIELMDYQSNPYKYMKAADAYVCSSYAEGYSTTVSEAVILGVPVITTECSGMREIFGSQNCGIICQNSEEGLFQALKSVMDSPQKLADFRTGVSVRSKDFSKQALIRDVQTFLETI